MKLSLSDQSPDEFRFRYALLHGAFDPQKRRGALAPLSYWRWKGDSFRLVFGIQMQYDGPSAIVNWDPNEIIATASLESPSHELLDKRTLRLKHLSKTTPANGVYRAVGLLSASGLRKDIRVHSVTIEINTVMVVAVWPWGVVAIGGWARFVAGDEQPWTNTYEPPRPPPSIPLEGWKAEQRMEDVHLIETKPAGPQ